MNNNDEMMIMRVLSTPIFLLYFFMTFSYIPIF